MDELHPGKFLVEKYLFPARLSASKLAARLDVSISSITQVVSGKRGISAEMALRLAKFFKTRPQYWLELQNEYELKIARSKLGPVYDTEFDTNAEADAEADTDEETESQSQEPCKDWKEQMIESGYFQQKDLEKVFGIYEKLGTVPVHFDQIAYDLGLEGGDTAALLTGLELTGWVKRLPADWYVRAK
ncbi:HigA family addiction module antidote protein [bacterium]|nr:HigA family addiction module antidote protein [bacterium]